MYNHIRIGNLKRSIFRTNLFSIKYNFIYCNLHKKFCNISNDENTLDSKFNPKWSDNQISSQIEKIIKDNLNYEDVILDTTLFIQTFLTYCENGKDLTFKLDKEIFNKFNEYTEEQLKSPEVKEELFQIFNIHLEHNISELMSINFQNTKKKIEIVNEIQNYIKIKESKNPIIKKELDCDPGILNEKESEIFELLKQKKSTVDISMKPFLDKIDESLKLGNITKIESLRNDTNRMLSEYQKINVLDKNDVKSDNLSQKKKKFNINVDTYNLKKDLNYNEEFNKISLQQKVTHPSLSMNLINVVQNPGIYPLNSIKKMNKNINLNLLENLPTPEMIQFENLDTYMRPHEDPNLKALLKKHKLKYSSSTSGIGESLTHFFYKLTNFKSPHFYNLSQTYLDEPLKFMMFQRKPASIVLHKIDKNSYAISKNSIFDSKFEIILLKMGKYMEKIFTNSPEEFKDKYMKSSNKSDQIIIKEDDFFNFISYDKILLRSQIDCGGKDKDGNDIVFEIKTRAVAPIRYDVLNYFDYLDYEINSLQGKHSSYEREFYDLIRGAFLKYLFQLKIGGMSGALISYHNTQKIYGFEYISLVDMERRILGNANFSDIIFKASLKLLQETLDYIVSDFPDENKILIGFFANEWKGTLDVFVEIVNENTYKDYEQLDCKEIIDYFYMIDYKPVVHKYTVIATPILNDVNTTFSPIMYENSDSYNVKYQIIYSGKPSFNEYMQFLHEAFMQKDSINIISQFTGTWSAFYEK